MYRSLLIAFFVWASANAYNAPAVSRRDWMNTIAATGSGVAAFVALPESSEAVISSKYCAYGTGDGCEDLAEGNGVTVTANSNLEVVSGIN